ncbi:uncharacterized protein PHACADRAFT_252911 [Phanerochaete carnosa HHB-10118-sp]|uniref:Uncharacterized protein n=1 Tax=Phanerochaete carnosa (strain HHB-10118-sp) TaxID=650164 RepID=K5V702_PHACS|nr:uncharacterized protein PHACADRAFT_252911 [Phanerochaete carnosa HHB-10118-sp]EKM58516.1 hypothetical protein PHACADRAFT_252911 [Phanerochaete carnosa HHB-10118-sp]
MMFGTTQTDEIQIYRMPSRAVHKNPQDAADLPLVDETCFKRFQRTKGYESAITSPWDETRRLDPINRAFGQLMWPAPCSC